MARPRKYFFMALKDFDRLPKVGDTLFLDMTPKAPIQTDNWRSGEDDVMPSAFTVVKIHPRKGGVTVVKVAA